MLMTSSNVFILILQVCFVALEHATDPKTYLCKTILCIYTIIVTWFNEELSVNEASTNKC